MALGVGDELFNTADGFWIGNPWTGNRPAAPEEVPGYDPTQASRNAQLSAQQMQQLGAVPFSDADKARYGVGGTGGPGTNEWGYVPYTDGAGQQYWINPTDPVFWAQPKDTGLGWEAAAGHPSDWRETHGGMAIMALPFVGAGITALGAGGASAGAAEGAGAGAGGGAGGGAGDAALAGGGEVGSGYAASAEGAGAGSGAATEGGSTLGTSEGNNGMWDYVDEYGYDPGNMYAEPASQPAADPTYSGNNNDPGYMYDSNGNYSTAEGTQNPTLDPNFKALAEKYGPQLAQKLVASGFGKSLGSNILGTAGSDPLQAGFNSLPFLYSLYEANRQGNQVDPILAKLSGLADTSMSNTNGLVASATGPYDRETMAGRDALMADQSARGVRGSSFGDQGITSYDTLRGRGRGELVGSTQAKALGLTGDLLNSQLKGTTNAATSKNLLIGAGLSASGKLFQPQQDPFGLANLLALTGGNA